MIEKSLDCLEETVGREMLKVILLKDPIEMKKVFSESGEKVILVLKVAENL